MGDKNAQLESGLGLGSAPAGHYGKIKREKEPRKPLTAKEKKHIGICLGVFGLTLLVVLIVLLVLAPWEPEPEPVIKNDTCLIQALRSDVIFVVSASLFGTGSEYQAYNDRLKVKLADVADRFLLGDPRSNTRFGMFTFTDEEDTTIPMTNDNADWKSSVNSISFSGGQSNPARAVKYLEEEFFAKQIRSGLDRLHVIFIMTGQSTLPNCFDPVNQAESGGEWTDQDEFESFCPGNNECLRVESGLDGTGAVCFNPYFNDFGSGFFNQRAARKQLELTRDAGYNFDMTFMHFGDGPSTPGLGAETFGVTHFDDVPGDFRITEADETPALLDSAFEKLDTHLNTPDGFDFDCTTTILVPV